MGCVVCGPHRDADPDNQPWFKMAEVAGFSRDLQPHSEIVRAGYQAMFRSLLGPKAASTGPSWRRADGEETQAADEATSKATPWLAEALGGPPPSALTGPAAKYAETPADKTGGGASTELPGALQSPDGGGGTAAATAAAAAAAAAAATEPESMISFDPKLPVAVALPGCLRHGHRATLRSAMEQAGFASVSFVDEAVAISLALYAAESDYNLPPPVRSRPPFQPPPAWHLHHVVIVDVGMGMSTMSLVRADRGARQVELRAQSSCPVGYADIVEACLVKLESNLSPEDALDSEVSGLLRMCCVQPQHHAHGGWRYNYRGGGGTSLLSACAVRWSDSVHAHPRCGLHRSLEWRRGGKWERVCAL